ncbi:hypothetical protein SAMN03159343_2253 [Klenkia marina]|uniref:Uncharacterized protein n=1 Tax=Klenkia marina TaxID=1960309 RepID=A0A1G4Y8G0_9ACTN|nr:hypothetical protein [Klenkia marina]SCX49693.1 hypothetical protein SAMN03159343_2253 [Klenkia marina]
MADDDTIVDAPPRKIVRAVEQMVDLPWPEGDEELSWDLQGLEGETTWLFHALPLAHRAGKAAKVLGRQLRPLLDERFGLRLHFHVDRPAGGRENDRHRTVARLVRSIETNVADWWRHDGNAVLLLDSTASAPHDDRLLVVVLPDQWMGPPGAEELALRSPVVQDLLSRDPGRVISAAWTLLGTRDPAVLTPVLTAVDAIEDATAGLRLGGALASNAGHLASGLERARTLGRGECLCTCYPGHSFYEPDREQAKGYVRVVGTVPDERQWVDDSICECTNCGRRYQVEHGEGHYPWWRWAPLG